MDTSFRINSDNVVHETIDGEVIAIDLTSGAYYSLSGCGPMIWGMLARGATKGEIAVALGNNFEATPGEIEGVVADLLDRLSESSLVLAGEGNGVAATETTNGVARRPFEPPVFERYTDMKDYFLLDPIHEVSAAEGWPKAAP
jgi:hypothetical protein